MCRVTCVSSAVMGDSEGGQDDFNTRPLRVSAIEHSLILEVREKHLSGFDPDPNGPERGGASLETREDKRRCKIITSGREDQGDSDLKEGAKYDEREGWRLGD